MNHLANATLIGVSGPACACHFFEYIPKHINTHFVHPWLQPTLTLNGMTFVQTIKRTVKS